MWVSDSILYTVHLTNKKQTFLSNIGLFSFITVAQINGPQSLAHVKVYQSTIYTAATRMNIKTAVRKTW